MSFENCLSCPLMIGLGSFSLPLYSSYGFEHYHIVFFFFLLRTFDPLDFSSCPLDLFGHLWWLRIFFYAPQCCFDTFNHEFFFLCLLHLPPVWGVILAKVIFKKSIRLKRGLQMIYFSLAKRLSKMAFPHLKHMHFGSVSLAFTRVCKVISHYSFK